MTITLEVTPRDETTSVKTLRANGSVPAVVYGHSQEATPIAMEAKTFDKVRNEAGESTLVELKGLKGKIEVLIKDVEFNPVKQQVMHVDFYAVEQGKEMTTDVQLNFIGEAPAEASKLGMVNKVLHEVEVTCKPADLPNHIDVNLESLVTLEDKIMIKDLDVPKGVTLTANEEDSVAVVNALREEEEEEVVEAPDMDSIEVEQKGKGEEEGGDGGEAEEKG